jgi:L-ascorbate metabolism protein UlaG (beta-lactamase superfamily)
LRRVEPYIPEEDQMKLKFYGHAAFLLKSDDGYKIIIDPYESGGFGGQLNYGKIEDEADIVLTSHEHPDHNYTKTLPGSPQVIKGAGSVTVKGITFNGIATYHDPSKGSQRGLNTAFAFLVDGVRICHLGDLGHILSDKELKEIGPVDILMVPVGGFYTIDPKEATRVIEQINPKIVIPMHFKTEKLGAEKYPLSTIEDFLKGKSNIKRPGRSELTFEKAALPHQTEILVLEPAL